MSPPPILDHAVALKTPQGRTDLSSLNVFCEFAQGTGYITSAHGFQGSGVEYLTTHEWLLGGAKN